MHGVIAVDLAFGRIIAKLFLLSVVVVVVVFWYTLHANCLPK